MEIPAGANADFLKQHEEMRTRRDRWWAEHVKEWPAGSLGLPPLLDARRIQYKMTNGYFRYQRVGDFVLVAQITYDRKTDELLAGAGLARPVAFEEAEIRRSYVGVLVSAGLSALDKLRPEGICLGHIVNFLNFTPWHAELDRVKAPGGGQVIDTGVELHVSDIRGSLDLASALNSGKCKRSIITNKNGVEEYFYTDADGNPWDPETPVDMEI